MSDKSLGGLAKEKLATYAKFIDGQLSNYFDQEIDKKFGYNAKQQNLVKDMLSHAQEHNLRDAKRLRAAFVHYGFQLGSQESDARVVKAAMAVEIVHTALLMMDDFMDMDEIRRGGPTTHKYYSKKSGDDHYGDSMAVNVGGAVMNLGYELLNECGSLRAMQQMFRGIANTFFGQAYDVSLEQFKDGTEEDVLVLHRAKTGIYTYENPLLIGAYLAGLNDDVLNILRDYARDGGVAFQLQDDILGVFGSTEKTGKSADSDLKQGKCTLLVLKTLENPVYRAKLEKVWGSSAAGKQDIESAKQAIIDSGSLEYSRNLARELAGNAAKTAQKLRNSMLNGDSIDFIQGIAEYMVNRDV